MSENEENFKSASDLSVEAKQLSEKENSDKSGLLSNSDEEKENKNKDSSQLY